MNAVYRPAGQVRRRLGRLYLGRMEDVCVGNNTGTQDCSGGVYVGCTQAGWKTSV
jgi:hypothetical protein